MFCQIVFSSTVLLILIIYIYYKSALGYWKCRKIPYILEPVNIGILKQKYLGIILKDLYDKIKSNQLNHAGVYLFTFPVYMPISPKLIKCVLQQDFNNFISKGLYYNEKSDVLSGNLFFLNRESWKLRRLQLSPCFTAHKIKILFDTLVQCGVKMQVALEDICQRGESVEIKEIATRYTIDVIGSSVYGLNCNSFKYDNTEFTVQAKKIFQLSFLRLMHIFACTFFPKFATYLGATVFMHETRDFFVDIVKKTVAFRKSNNIVRKDVLQFLIDLCQKEKGESIAVEQISADAFAFFAAGFETSSTTISFCLYELAVNTDIQSKVRKEIFDTLIQCGHNLSYDTVMEMVYLGQIIDETLRKYPVVAYLLRKCSEDYKIPDTNVILSKDTHVAISVLGLHRDPEYFPDPEIFNPDRFSRENGTLIKPFTYLPFGYGPRNCIGLRFGLLQVKVGIISLLSQYKFSLNSKTKHPLDIDLHSITLISKYGIYLDIEKIIK